MKTVFIILLVSLYIPGFAQDSTKSPSVKFHGYADLYYQWSEKDMGNKEIPPFYYNFRRTGNIRTNLCLLGITYKKRSFQFNADLMDGDYSRYNLSGEPGMLRHVYQLNGSFNFLKTFSVSAGILPSHIGLETAISRDNWNLSRSVLAENSPYYETGIRLSLNSASGNIFSLLVTNGWQHIKDNNHSLAAGTQVQVKIKKNLLINSSTFLGREGNDRSGFRLFHDFYLTLDLNRHDKIAFLFDSGVEKKSSSDWPTWWGTALIVQHKFSNYLSAAVRTEYFRDENGVIISAYTPLRFRVYGFSANFDYAPFKRSLFRCEFKRIMSPEALFKRNNEQHSYFTSLIAYAAFYF